MLRPHMTLAAIALAGCAAAPIVPADLARRMAEAPEDTPARLLLSGDRLVGAAVALGPAAVPPPVRAAIDAVAPQGETIFLGREWGLRGAGIRVEKRYRLGGDEHLRTALIADDGRVLERAHSVPLGEVPKSVVEAALQVGPSVESPVIVSGPAREEYWRCTVGDRIGRRFVVTVDLDGRLRSVHRRVSAAVDV